VRLVGGLPLGWSLAQYQHWKFWNLCNNRAGIWFFRIVLAALNAIQFLLCWKFAGG
jgi:hypothetical protein